MRYKLLENKKGIILTRSPEFLVDAMACEFEDVPEGATAIFEYEDGKIKYFRELKSKGCEIPLRRLESGKLTVTIAVLDGSADPLRWRCEELKLHKFVDGSFMVLPNDGDLPAQTALLQVETDALQKKITYLEEKYKSLADQLEQIMEGYNLT